EVDEPFADDPVDVRNRRRPAIRALLGVVDADDVVGTRAAEVLRPRLVVRRDARVDHEARAADRELVAEYVVVAVRRALAVEQQDIAGLAGKDVEAALPEGARLGTLAPPWEVGVRPAPDLTDDEERPDAEVAGRCQLRLVEDDGRGREELARGPPETDPGAVEERDLAGGMQEPRQEVRHPLDALAGPRGHVVVRGLEDREEFE